MNFLSLKLSYLTLFILSLTTIQAQEKESRKLAKFDKLLIKGAMDIELIPNAKPSINMEYKNLEAAEIITEVKNNTLVIELKKKKHKNIDLKVKLYFQTLESIENQGAINLYSDAILKAEHFNIESEGAGKIELEVKTQDLQIVASGASEVEISGATKEQRIELNGAGNVKAYDLDSEIADVVINGVGNLQINVKKNLKAEINGLGNIKYKGNPEVTSLSKNGIGSIASVD